MGRFEDRLKKYGLDDAVSQLNPVYFAPKVKEEDTEEERRRKQEAERVRLAQRKSEKEEKEQKKGIMTSQLQARDTSKRQDITTKAKKTTQTEQLMARDETKRNEINNINKQRMDREIIKSIGGEQEAIKYGVQEKEKPTFKQSMQEVFNKDFKFDIRKYQNFNNDLNNDIANAVSYYGGMVENKTEGKTIDLWHDIIKPHETEDYVEKRLTAVEKYLTNRGGDLLENASHYGISGYEKPEEDEGAITSVFEGWYEREIRNMLSKEHLKQAEGEPNKVDLIDKFLEEHPELQDYIPIEKENSTWYKFKTGALRQGFGGVTRLGFDMLRDSALDPDTYAWTIALASMGTLSAPAIGSSLVGLLPTSASAPMLAGELGSVMKVAQSLKPVMAIQMGMQFGTTKAMATLEMVDSYQDMIETGVDPRIAKKIAPVVGVFNGLIEQVQWSMNLKGLPAMKTLLTKAEKVVLNEAVVGLTSVAKEYGVNVASNVLEEVIQGMITHVGTSVGIASQTAKYEGLLGLNSILDSAKIPETHQEFLQFKQNVANRESIMEVAKMQAINGLQTFWAMPLGSTALQSAGIVSRSYVDGKRAKAIETQVTNIDNATRQAQMDDITTTLEAVIGEEGYLDTVIEDYNETKDPSNIPLLTATKENFQANLNKGFTNEQKTKMAEKIAEIDALLDKEMKEAKEKDTDIEFNTTDRQSLEDEILSDDYVNTKQTALNELHIELFKEAKSSGIVEKIREGLREGKMRGEIAKTIKKGLQLNQRNKTEALVRRYDIIKAVEAVDAEISKKVSWNTNANIAKSMDLNKNQEKSMKTEKLNEDATSSQEGVDASNEQEVADEDKTSPQTTDSSETVQEDVTSVEETTKPIETLKTDSTKLKKSTLDDVKIVQAKVNDIKFDTEKFQFRFDKKTDDRLSDVDWVRFNEGVVTLYQNEYGDLYAVDGHHRIEQMQERGIESVNAKILSYEDYTVEEARAIGAGLNIAEGNATSIDVAKVLRDSQLTKEELINRGVSPTSKILRDGEALANLNENIFNKVVTKGIGLERAVIIGKQLGGMEDAQNTLMKSLALVESKGKTITNDVLTELIAHARGMKQDDYEVVTLFGKETMTKDYTIERAELVSYVKNQLKSKKNLLKNISKDKNAVILQELGNKIAVDENVKNMEIAEQALWILDKTINYEGTTTNQLFNDLAKEYANADNKTAIKKKALNMLVKEMEGNKLLDETINQKVKEADLKTKIDQAKEKPSKEQQVMGLEDRIEEDNTPTRKPRIEYLKEQDPVVVVVSNEAMKEKSYTETIDIVETMGQNPLFNGLTVEYTDELGEVELGKGELIARGYADLADKLEQGETRIYKEKGYFKSGRNTIYLNRSATRSTIIEEAIHYAQQEVGNLSYTYAEAIKDWEIEVRFKADELGLAIPEGKETLAKALLHSEYGYASENPTVAKIFAVDQDILNIFEDLLGKDMIAQLKGESFTKDPKVIRPLNIAKLRQILSFKDRNHSVLAPNTDGVYAQVHNQEGKVSAEFFSNQFGYLKTVDYTSMEDAVTQLANSNIYQLKETSNEYDRSVVDELSRVKFEDGEVNITPNGFRKIREGILTGNFVRNDYDNLVKDNPSLTPFDREILLNHLVEAEKKGLSKPNSEVTLKEFLYRFNEKEIAQDNEISIEEVRKNYLYYIDSTKEKTGLSTDTGALMDIKRRLENQHKYFQKSVETYRNNGLQYQIQPMEEKTDSQEFKDWFRDSKVVDEDGKPLIVYHGSYKNFSRFNLSKTGWNTNNQGLYGRGFYFTDRLEYAKSYGENLYESYVSMQKPFVISGEDATIEQTNLVYTMLQSEGIPTYEEFKVNTQFMDKPIHYIRNSIINNAKKFRKALMKNGYDGVIFDNSKYKVDAPYMPNSKFSEIVVFKPTQIKSINNIGTFDGNNEDINYQLTETSPIDAEGFYSKLENHIRSNKMPNKGIGSDLYNILKKVTTQEEMEWFKLEQINNNKKYTREDILAIMNERPIDITENKLATFREHTLTKGQGLNDYTFKAYSYLNLGDYEYKNSAHFGNLKNVVAHTRYHSVDGILTNERGQQVGKDQKVMLIEELQSDLHTQGRDKGYVTIEEMDKKRKEKLETYDLIRTKEEELRKTKYEMNIKVNDIEQSFKEEDYYNWNSKEHALMREATEKITNSYEPILSFMEKEIDSLYYDLNKGLREFYEKAPDAPFKKGAIEFMFKQNIKDAVNGGYDGIAWTTGLQQARRWQYEGVLNENIKQIQWERVSEFEYNISIDENISTDFGVRMRAEDMLQEFGSAIYDEITKNKQQTGIVTPTGVDTGFYGSLYDAFLPRIIKKFAKKYGGEYTSIPLIMNDQVVEGQPYMAITNEMRKMVIEEGQPIFQLEEVVDDNLQAIHNLGEGQLVSSLKMGGFVMPSLAITKADYEHTRYGEISLLFDRDTIDPQRSRDNRVYSGDAYTPTYPYIAQKISESVSNDIDKRVNGVLREKKLGDTFRLSLDVDNMLDKIERYGNFKEAYQGEPAMMITYLAEKGIEFELPMTEAEYNWDYDVMDGLAKLLEDNLEIGNLSFEDYKRLEPSIRATINGYYQEALGKDLFKAEMGFGNVAGLFTNLEKYNKDTTKMVIDTYATKDMLLETIDQNDYSQWLDEISEGIVEKEGVRNNVDRFTPSGNRRKWEALHDPVTLKALLKSMKSESEKASDAFGGIGKFRASVSDTFTSITEIKKNAHRLQNIDEALYEEMQSEHTSRLLDLASRLADKRETNQFIATDRAIGAMEDALQSSNTKEGIMKTLGEYYGLTYDGNLVDEMMQLAYEVSQMPTEYFEAKPRRIIEAKEVRGMVAPNDVSQETLDLARANGINTIALYDAEIDGDRARAVREVTQAENILFQMTEEQNETMDEYYNKAVSMDKEYLSWVKTLKKNPNISDAMKDLLIEDNFKYNVIHNIDTMVFASKALEKHGDEYWEGVLRNPDTKGSAIEFAVGQILTYKFMQNGQVERATAITDNMARKAKTLGQAIQILSVLGRQTPEGMMRYVSGMLSGLTTQSEKDLLNLQSEDVVEAFNKIDKEALKEVDFKEGAEQLTLLEPLTPKDKRSLIQKISDLANLYYKKRNFNLLNGLKELGLDEDGAKMVELFIRGKIDIATNKKKKALLEKNFKKQSYERATLDQDIIDIHNDGGIDAVRGKIAEKTGMPIFTAKDAQWVYDRSVEINKMVEGSREKDVAIARLLADIGDLIPVDKWDKVNLLQTMAQLMNAKTILRNLIGNAIFGTVDTFTHNYIGVPIDMLASAFTGERTAIHRGILKIAQQQWKGYGQGLKLGYEDAKLGIDTFDTRVEARLGGQSAGNKYDIRSNRTFKNEMDKVRSNDYSSIERVKALGTTALSKLETGLNITMRATDRGAFMGAYMDSIHEQLLINKVADMKELAYEQQEQIVANATALGLYRTFNDASTMSKGFRSIKKGLNLMSSTVLGTEKWGLGDLVLKYPQTPANILQRVIDYSPIGVVQTLLLVSRATDASGYLKQKMVVDSLARGISGTSTVAIGALLAYMGIATGGISDEPDKIYDIKKQVGLRDYGINITALRRWLNTGFKDKTVGVLRKGDMIVSYDWVEPMAVPIAVGADILLNGTEGILQTALDATATGVTALTEQPLLSGLTSLFGYGDIAKGTGNQIMGIPASFTPTLLGHIAGLIDGGNKDPYTAYSDARIAYNKVINKLPFAKGTLPDRYSVFGERLLYTPEEENFAFKVFRNILSPAFYDRYDPEDEVSYILDLYEKTGELDIIPKAPQKSYTFDGEKFELNPQEYEEMSEWLGLQVTGRIKQALNINGFKNWSLPDQEEEIRHMLKELSKEARVKVQGMRRAE